MAWRCYAGLTVLCLPFGKSSFGAISGNQSHPSCEGASSTGFVDSHKTGFNLGVSLLSKQANRNISLARSQFKPPCLLDPFLRDESEDMSLACGGSQRLEANPPKGLKWTFPFPGGQGRTALFVSSYVVSVKQAVGVSFGILGNRQAGDLRMVFL